MSKAAWFARCIVAAVIGGCADANLFVLAGPGPLPQDGLFLGCPDYDAEKKLPELANGSTALADANHGSFSVSSGGDAHFSMPIAVAPGRAGMVPATFVSYSSTSDDGFLGFGFSLGGLGAITRCPKNLAQNAEIAPVRDDAGDVFCMDGARLVEIAPNEYRTIPDLFVKIIANTNASGPLSFTIYEKSGLIFEYGGEDHSRVMARKGVVRSWLLSEQRDRNGNAIRYTYKNERDPDDFHTLEFAPERIDYTDHPDAPASRAVVFKYEAREPWDVREFFARGMKLKRSLKLKKIETLGPGNSLVREYRFDYTTSPNTQRMLLKSVQECAADQACKPPTRFTYYHGQGTGFEEALTNVPGPSNDIGTLLTADMTGDGLDDILISEQDAQLEPGEDKTVWRLLPNKGQGPAFFDESILIFEQPHLIDPQTFLPGPPDSATPMDFNHDGRMDLLLHDLRGAFSKWSFLVSNGSELADYQKSSLKRPFPSGAQPPLYFNSVDQSSHLVDISGDGMPDMVHCKFENFHTWSVHLWTPQGFDANAIAIPTLLQHPCDIEFIAVDLDADGQNEILVPGVFSANGGLQFTTDYDALSFEHQGNTWSRKDAGLPRPLVGGRVVFMDANGDGLLDALQSGFQDEQLRIFLNTGDGFTDAFNALSNAIPELDKFFGGAAQIDWNSDGRQDLLLPIQGGLTKPEWRILQANGKPGDGAFDIVDPGIPFEALLSSASASLASPHGPRVTDLNGDGLQDLLLVAAKHIRVYKNTLHGEEDRLHTITDGQNPWDENDAGFVPNVAIEYDHLIDRSITEGVKASVPAASRTYLSKNGSAPEECEYPMHCVVGSKRVVSHYSIYQGGSETHDFEVAYRNARHHRLGRGFLGFGNKILRDLDTGAGESLFFDNVSFDANTKSFPYIGRPMREIRWNPSAYVDPIEERYPIEMSFLYRGQLIVPTNNEQSFFVLTALQSERRDQGFVLNNSLLAAEFYAREREDDPANTMAKSHRYVLKHDEYGNILEEHVITADQSERTQVTREFENNTQDWLIGILKKETKCSESNGIEQCRYLEREYDAAGKLQTEFSADGAKSQATQLFLTIQRDGFGNAILTHIQDAFGNSRPSCITYEAEGIFPWASSNGANLVQYYAYDPGLGVLKTHEDPNGLITKFRVDGFGRTVEEQRPDGTHTTISITRTKDGGPAQNQWNTKIQTTTLGHQDDSVQLDALGRVVKSWTQKPQGLSQAVHPRIMQVFEYDALGEKLYKRSLPAEENTPLPNLHFDEYLYDGMGRLVKHIAPWGAVTGYRYSGRKVEVTAPGGAITLIENDRMGRPLFISDPELGMTSYSYGPLQALSSVLDASGALTVYERDALGRVTALHDPDRGTTISEYNGFGEFRHSEDALGRTVDLAYDRIGRLVSRLDGDGLSYWLFDQAANGRGKLGEAVGAAGHKTLYSYDGAGRLSKTEKIIDGESFSIGLSYDAYSRVQAIQYPGGFSVQREYDPYGHLRKIKHGAETLWQLLGADGAGRINYEQFGTEVTTLREYWQEKNRLKHIHTSTATEVHQELEYAYDERLNLSFRKDLLQNETEVFLYDQLDRLTHSCLSSLWVQVPCPKAFEYDASGNLLSKLDVGSYEYEPNRPHMLSKAGGALYVHDAVGNLREKPGALIDYSAFDLPRKASIKNDELNFDYDAHQQRIRKRSLTQETIYFDQLYERVSDSVSGKSEHRFFVYSDERLVAIHTESNQAGSDIKYVHVDHLGSTDVITDSQGQVVERRSYDAFGQERNPLWGSGPLQSGPPAINRGFTSHESDSELGLINMRGRLMDPHLGRFTTPDPIIANPGFSQSWNPFAYVNNSPLSAIDPSGFTGEDVGVPMAPPLQNPSEGWPEGWSVSGYAVFALQAGIDVDTSTLPVFDFENNIADYPIDLGLGGLPGGYAPQRSPAESETPRNNGPPSGGDIAIEAGIGVAEGVGSLLWDVGKFVVLNGVTLGGYGCYKLWEGAYAGYKEWGVLGIFNTIVSVGTIVNGTEGTLAAISAGDYRAAGKTGIQTLLIAVATAITLGEGAAALVGGKGAGTAAIGQAENAALKNAAKEGAAAELGTAAKDIGPIRNAHLAGSAHPKTGVPFDKSGYPDFYAYRHPNIPDVRIEPSGLRSTDFARANAAAGLEKTPAGYTWHHHQDKGLMQLVESDVHQYTGHTGGFSRR